MTSWQSRDSIPICCGWLWILVARHPQFPPGVHEAIHADGGQGGFAPQPSTGVHARSTTFSTVTLIAVGAGSKPSARSIHTLSTARLNCPHDYPQGCGREMDGGGGAMSAHLCTQGPSCPQILACYPRWQEARWSVASRSAISEKTEKSGVARGDALIHNDCG